MRSSVAWSRCIFLPLMVHVSSVPDLDDRYRTPVVYIVSYPVLTYPDTLPFFSPELAAVPRTRGASAMSSMARLRRSASLGGTRLLKDLSAERPTAMR